MGGIALRLLRSIGRKTRAMIGRHFSSSRIEEKKQGQHGCGIVVGFQGPDHQADLKPQLPRNTNQPRKVGATMLTVVKGRSVDFFLVQSSGSGTPVPERSCCVRMCLSQAYNTGIGWCRSGIGRRKVLCQSVSAGGKQNSLYRSVILLTASG